MSDPKHPRATESEQFIELIKLHLKDWVPTRILDIGASDATQSVELSKAYPKAIVYAFEANPKNHGYCRKTIQGKPAIRFIPKAVCEHNGTTTFYDVPTNGGAGSIFPPSGVYDVIEKLPSVQIEVPCTRLDTFLSEEHVAPFDTLWLDAQGSELCILRSLGVFIFKVKAIWTEFEVAPIYSGQPLMPDLTAFLVQYGFTNVHEHECAPGFFGEACFLRLK